MKWPEQIFHLFSAAANRGVISIGLKLVTAAVIFYYNNIYIYLFIVVIFTIYIKKLTIIITYNALCLFSVINPVDELNDCTKTQWKINGSFIKDYLELWITQRYCSRVQE